MLFFKKKQKIKGRINFMEKEKIERINFLAKKSREEGLNDAEKAEQKILREEYLNMIRQNFRSTLENIEIVDDDKTPKA